MSSKRSAVVVTGYGAVTALGPDAQSTWEALLLGRSAIRAAPGDSFPPTARVPAESLGDPLAPRASALAARAAEEAVHRACIGEQRETAVIVGTTAGDIAAVEDALEGRDPGAPLQRELLLDFEKAGIADSLAARFGFEGLRFAVSTACASSASAILLAQDRIESGQAEVVLAGGTDALARITLAGFRALRALDSVPCRPFDRARRGLTLGEGAAMLVLERRDHAEARGAVVYAELRGSAQTTDGHHLTAPLEDGAGAARAIGAALARARLRPEDVGYVNAHGTGTPANDAAEARAIRSAFGPHAARCPVSSIKGAIGHTLGAAGAVEAVATVLALASGFLPPTAGLREPDPAFELDLVRGSARRANPAVALSSSFGFGGANTVLCFARASA